MDHNHANGHSGSRGPPYQQAWYQQVPASSSQCIPPTNVLQPGTSSFQAMYPSYQCPPAWYQQVAANVPSASGPQQFQQNYEADASKETDEPDLYECVDPPVASPIAPRRRKKMATRVKLSNFLPDEDVNLVKSWLEISTDPITNTGQRKERTWERILQRYNTRRASYDERTVKSLQSHWDTIKTGVGKFCGYYADTVRENASGTSDADKTTMAAANYASMQKHSFGFMHCWEIMKDKPKWQDPKARASARSTAGEGFGEETHHGAATEDIGDDNSSPTRTARRRPMGRDSAKASKKTTNSSAGSSASAEYAARQQDIREAQLAILQEDALAKKDRFQKQTTYNMSLLTIEQEKISLLREKHEMDKLEKEKQEERMLAIDITKCLPSQRLYYQSLQEEIVEKQTTR